MWEPSGALLVFVVLFLRPLACAHGAGKLGTGRVTAVDAQHVGVKANEGLTLSILLTKEVNYGKGETAATRSDLKVGDHVVVHTTGKENMMLMAREVRFSSADDKTVHEGMTHRTTTP